MRQTTFVFILLACAFFAGMHVEAKSHTETAARSGR